MPAVEQNGDGSQPAAPAGNLITTNGQNVDDVSNDYGEAETEELLRQLDSAEQITAEMEGQLDGILAKLDTLLALLENDQLERAQATDTEAGVQRCG